MKKLFQRFLYLAVLAGVVSSCDSESTETPSGEARMISFGFYAADNEGVLFDDYVVSDSLTTSWTINLPEEVDRSSLVARFVTTKNDSVTINGVGQLSGVTENNFSLPLDYVVTDGINNKRYTITVGKASAFIWSKLNTFEADSTAGIQMKVNPVNGMPYLLYKQDRVNSADEKAAMVRFNGTTWEFVGDAAGLSPGRIGTYMDFTFDSNGLPYVAYPDYSTTTTQLASVRKFNGTQWESVGTPGITAGAVTYTALAFAPDNKLVLLNTLNAAAGGLAKREMDVSYFDGSAWSTSNKITGRTADQSAYLQVAKLVNGVLYVGVFNATTPSNFSVYTYSNGTWTILADKVMEAGATSSNLRDFDMDVDREGNIYIAVADDASKAGTYNPRVKKYDALTKAWSNIGSVIDVNLDVIRKFDLAVSPYGVPFLMYRNGAQYPTVVSFNTETQQWNEPVILEQSVADDVWMDFAPNGKGYATFTNGSGRAVNYIFSAPAAN